MRIRYKIEGVDKVSGEFKQAQRVVRKNLRTGLRKAAEHAAEPRAKAASPVFTRTAITSRATTTRAFITTQGPKRLDRALGLLNFGGTVSAPIEPKRKLALTVAPGVIRARVTKPRKYRGRLFLNKAIQASVPEMERIMLPSIMQSFDGLDHTP